MRIDVKFSETSQTFNPSFGEVQIASDGGYERGYAQGYEVGAKEVQAIEDGLLTRNLSADIYCNDRITSLGRSALWMVQNVAEYNFPNVTKVEDNVFVTTSYNPKIIRLPKAKQCGQGAFSYCYGLQTLELEACETLIGDACRGLWVLERLELPSLVSPIQANCFNGCKVLETLVLGANTVCTLQNTNAFNDTPIAKGTGFIYVPSALVEQYKAATNWSTYASQIRAIEDYPEITE